MKIPWLPSQQRAAAAILKTSSLDLNCGRRAADIMAAKRQLVTEIAEALSRSHLSRLQQHHQQQHQEQQPPQEPVAPQQDRPQRQRTHQEQSQRPPEPLSRRKSSNSPSSVESPEPDVKVIIGGACAVEESGPFRHNFDSCVHCDWIWKSDACDAFYRELATANVESITYELASHPNPGLFSKFFGEKGYQRGKAVVAQPPTSKTDVSSKPPRGWSSETDWRRRISGVADVEKQSRKSTKLVMAQRAVSRLRHWTSGHQATDKMTTPARKDDEDDARSVEESTTLLDKDTTEDASTGSSVTKTSSSAGDLLKKAAPSSLKTSRKARSTLSVVVNTAGNTRASGDFCSKAGVIRFNGGPGGSLKPAGKIMAGMGSDDTWPGKKLHQAECTQRSIDGFFKRFVRKK